MDFSPLWGLCRSAGDALSSEKKHFTSWGLQWKAGFTLNVSVSTQTPLWGRLIFSGIYSQQYGLSGVSFSLLFLSLPPGSWRSRQQLETNTESLWFAPKILQSEKSRDKKSPISAVHQWFDMSKVTSPLSSVFFFKPFCSFCCSSPPRSCINAGGRRAFHPQRSTNTWHIPLSSSSVVLLLRRPFRMRRKVSQPFKTQSLESPGCPRGIDWPAEKSERRVIGLKGEGTWTKMKQQESGSWVWWSLAKVFSASQLTVHNVAANNSRAPMALLQPLRAATRCQGIGVTATMARCR